MKIGTGCSRSWRLGNTFSFASNWRRDPCGLDHVPSWHHDFVDHSKLLRGFSQYPIDLHFLRQWNSMMFSMHIFLISMLRMLIMWLTGLYCRWNQMENYSRSLNVYCKKRCSCSRSEQLSKLKCNGMNLSSMKLHGRWHIRCQLCILPCLSFEAKKLWYGGVVYALWWCGICFMVVWYMLDGGLIYDLWCFHICLDMAFNIFFNICFGIWFYISFGIYSWWCCYMHICVWM